MGAWGEQPFDNDDAGDWGYEFDGADEATGMALLAAAEVLSWMLDHRAIPDSPYGEDPASWVRATGARPDDELVAAALAALDRVRSDNSELAELWAESDDDGAWRDSLARIETRLRSRG